VQVQGADWYIADSATVIGSVVIADKASKQLQPEQL
jgi:carbonic anhydrase/acetyltransferase-like protein (isoleucine patch superfamily)